MLSTAEKKLRNSVVRNSIYEYLCGTKEQKLTEEQSQEQDETETLSEEESQAPVTQTM